MKTSIANKSLACIFELIILIIPICMKDAYGCQTAFPQDPDITSLADIEGEMPLDFKIFNMIAGEFIVSRVNRLTNDETWLRQENPFMSPISVLFRNEFDKNMIFYAQKLFIKEDMKIISLSDIHADLKSLQILIRNMIREGHIDVNLKMDPKSILIGLGDYVDRGGHSLQVLTLLLLIAIKNPANVILLRGNHEDLNPFFQPTDVYKLDDEIRMNFGSQCISDSFEFDPVEEAQTQLSIKKTRILLTKIYDSMPSVLYLAHACKTDSIIDILIFAHGLLDFKFNPYEFLEFDNTDLAENGGVRSCIIKKNIATVNDVEYKGYGFLWHDLGIVIGDVVELDQCSYRFKYNPNFVVDFCKKHCPCNIRISGMVGGHDHFFAKNIGSYMGIDLGTVSPAGGYLLVNNNGPAPFEIGLISTNNPTFQNYFSFVKFTSAPNGIAYLPTYLVVDRSANTWNYRLSQCLS